MKTRTRESFALVFCLILLSLLASCSKESEKNSALNVSSKASSSQQTANNITSSSQITRTYNPGKSDLTAKIWYDETSMNYVVFDGNKMTMWVAQPDPKAIGNPPISSFSYSTNDSLITFEYGMMGVDNQFVMSWDGDKIILRPNSHDTTYGKVHEKILIPIDDLVKLPSS